MSSSVSNAIRCAANAAGIKAKSGTLNNDESELAFLQEKPTVGRKPASKARRNSFIKYMMKRDQNDKIVQKIVVNESKLSKKRRAKILSNINDDFNFDVPYSLNRKNRWEDVESAGDFVKTSNESDDVIVSGADYTSPYGCYHHGTNASAYHELAPGGELKSKICSNPQTGANLESLKDSLNPKSKKNKRRSRKLAFAKILNEDENPIGEDEKPHIRYAITKTSTVPMLYAGWIYKGTGGSGWDRTRNYKDEDYLDDLEPANFDDEPEVDMTSSIAALYRAPKQSTFSLADFIKDSSPAVLVNCKSIESIVDNHEKSDFVENPVKQQQSSTTSGAVVDERKLCKDTIFIEIEVEKSKICKNSNLVQTFAGFEDRPELRFRWLNSDKNRCVFDLTKKLDEHTSKMAMVVIIEELKSKEGFLRVVLNGSFGCPSGVVIDFLKEKSFSSADAFLEQFVERLQKWYNKSQESKKQLNSLATLNSIFHGHQLAKPVEPSGDYVIVDEAAAKAPTVEAIMIDVEEEEDDMDFDEFEVVEMDDLISEDEIEEESQDEIEVLPEFGTGCDLCDTDNVDELVMLDNCGHRFCKRCLRTELTDAIVRNTAYPLTCLHDTCTGGIQMDFLITILPLPLAEYYFRFAFMAENIANGKTVVECPHCQDLASVDEKPNFGSVKCTRCSISFCSRCQHQPHFPLSCAQMAIWEGKFEKQFPMDIARKNENGNKKCSCGQILKNQKNQNQINCTGCNVTYVWKSGEPTGRMINKVKNLEVLDFENLPNNISGEFSEICSQARSLRFNLVANRQITKKMCKSVDFRLKQGFIEIRKTALHLIEFGFAWLYMTRSDKPPTWSSVKSNLSNLRSKLETIHSDIERGQTEGIELKVNELNNLTQKILDEFSAMS